MTDTDQPSPRVDVMRDRPDWLELAMGHLTQADRNCFHRFEISAARGHRVGLNDVWKITSVKDASQTYFAKFADKPAQFRRELVGLHIARQMAREHEFVVAIDTVLVDEERSLIVTTGMPGESFQKKLKRAFRIDRNPFQRKKHINESRRCLALIVQWLKLLHHQPIVDGGELLDLTPDGIRMKLKRVMDQLVAYGVRPPKSFVRLMEEPPATRNVDVGAIALVHGDVAPRHFFFSGSRVGVIDFGFLGHGSYIRDFVSLESRLRHCGQLWHYRDCRVLFDLLPAACPRPEMRAVYQLESALSQLLVATKSKHHSRRNRPLSWVREHSRRMAEVEKLVRAIRSCHKGSIRSVTE